METIEIMKQYLAVMGVPFTPDHVEQRLSAMPDGDSMFGLSLLLSEYGVRNHCLRFKAEDLHNLDSPFITILSGHFVIAAMEGKSEVRITGSSGKSSVVPLEEFRRVWNHTGLVGNPSEKSAEPELKSNRRRSLLSFLMKLAACVSITILSVFAILNDHSGGFLRFSLLPLNMAGAFITFLLLQKDLDIPNKITGHICGLVKKNDCSDVTRSAAATIFGTIHLSEIGAAFFFTNTLALLLSHDAVPCVSVAAILSLPFIAWSVGYQKFKLRGWCALCLFTAAILFLQAVVSVIGFNIREILPLPAIFTGVIIVSGYVLNSLGINYVMKVLRKSMILPQCERAYYSLKGKGFVIEGYLRAAPVYDVSREICSDIIFGNPEARNLLTVISNPYCHPCSMLHKHIEGWPGADLAVQCVFTSFSEEKLDINRALIAAYRKFGPEKTWEILCDWFRDGKDEGFVFFDNMGLDIEDAEINEELHKQMEWFAGNRFTGTPTILINGKEIRPPYGIEDYHYLKR